MLYQNKLKHEKHHHSHQSPKLIRFMQTLERHSKIKTIAIVNQVKTKNKQLEKIKTFQDLHCVYGS